MQLSVKTEVMGKEANAPMKFSFSKTKPSNRRPPLPPRDRTAAAVATTDEIEYVTSLDAVRGLVSVNPRRGRSAKVVPKLENSWRPEKRMKNIMVEADVTKPTEETFDMETMAAGPKPDVQYGLTLMTTDDDGKVGFTSEGSEAASTSRRMSFKEVEDQKLREDMLTLPDSASLESYEDLPVEDFGEALLRGMGWEKGKPIGRNSKIVVAPIEYVKRAGRLGLGADPAPPKETSKKYIKPGETREKKPDLVAPPSTSGRSRNVIDSDTKLVERVRRGVAKGKVMSIILGRHAGLRGEVVDINTEAGDAGIQIVVKLVKSGEKVVLNEHELADVGSHEEESALKIGNENYQEESRKGEAQGILIGNLMNRKKGVGPGTVRIAAEKVVEEKMRGIRGKAIKMMRIIRREWKEGIAGKGAGAGEMAKETRSKMRGMIMAEKETLPGIMEKMMVNIERE